MPEWLTLVLTLPVVTGLIGWGTNYAAVKMIFHPASFVGLGPLGWQGILYKQGEKFATGVADMVQDNLISADEIAERVDPGGVEALLARHLEGDIPETCRQLADELVGKNSWDNLPEHVQTMIADQAAAQTREVGRAIFADLQEQLQDMIDVHGIVYKQLSGENVSRLARLTKRIGKSEFKFIEYYGGIFGLIVGMMQVGLWTVMQRWWLMPLVGVFVGLVTNWLAIQMIFRPQEPKKYFFGLITYQGLFAKRQPDIARDYGLTARDEILTPRVFLRLFTEGENGLKLMNVVRERVRNHIRGEWQKFGAMMPFELTDDKLAAAEAVLTRRMLEAAPRIQPELEAYLEEKLDIGNTVETRLADLPKDDFERILRGIFEEDELTLILVGGFLGGAVGLLQGAIVLYLEL